MSDANNLLRDIAKFYEKAVEIIASSLQEMAHASLKREDMEGNARAIIARLANANILLEGYDATVKTETLNWISVQTETPDEGVVVLLHHPEASEPVWPGVFEGCTADGYAFSHADGSMISGPVLAWAEFPGGPE